MNETPHSAPVLTDLRDEWWSADFLKLLITRLSLADCQAVADIGSGHGHWGQLLLRLLSPAATLSGVDQEERWVEKAKGRAADLGIGARCTYQVGDAAALPLADESFDLVTCQTLLMHVEDPRRVLAEMIRILRPGGRLLLLEPNNVAQQMIADTVNRALTPTQLGAVFTLFVTCSRGRARLGRGDDCIGDRLPMLVDELGLSDLEVFQNERVKCITPPYSDVERAHLVQTLSFAEKGFWLWDKEDARRLYEAGGGESRDFENQYSAFELRTTLFEKQVQEESYASNNGSLHYVISARRPSRSSVKV